MKNVAEHKYYPVTDSLGDVIDDFIDYGNVS